MANISDSFGELTIKATNKKSIAKLIMLMAKRLENADYETVISDNWNDFPEDVGNLAPIEDRITQNDEGDYEIALSFYGSGRWSYITNMECIKKWTEQKVRNDDPLLDLYFEEIREEDIWMQFDVTDYETGNAFIYEGQYIFDWGSGILLELHCDNYDFTAEHMHVICGQYCWYDTTLKSLKELYAEMFDAYAHKPEIIKVLEAHPDAPEIWHERYKDDQWVIQGVEEVMEYVEDLLEF